MTDISLREHLKNASKAQKDKYTTEDFRTWGKLSMQKRTAGMTELEISEYFRNIGQGKKVKDST